MKYLWDTNIISEPTKKHPNPQVIKRMELDGIFSCTSATAWMELRYGVHLMPTGERKNRLHNYLEVYVEDGFNILPFCQNAAEWLASERVRLKKRGITPSKYDSEIAAVAMANNLILVTRNTDDFKIFKELTIENWFEE